MPLSPRKVRVEGTGIRSDCYFEIKNRFQNMLVSQFVYLFVCLYVCMVGYYHLLGYNFVAGILKQPPLDGVCVSVVLD